MERDGASPFGGVSSISQGQYICQHFAIGHPCTSLFHEAWLIRVINDFVPYPHSASAHISSYNIHSGCASNVLMHARLQEDAVAGCSCKKSIPLAI